ARAGVARGVPELRHRPCLDLADALAGQLEALADLFEGPGLATMKSETQSQDVPFALVERSEKAVDLDREERGRGHLEGRGGRAVRDDVRELSVAVLAEVLPGTGRAC